MFCAKCGNPNDDAAKFCSGCGSALSQAQPFEEAPIQAAGDAALTPDAFYQAIVGTSNQSYYLEKFSRFDGEGKASLTWHWPAFFVTFYWLLYRKMWLNAFIYFLLPYIVIVALAGISVAAGDSAGIIVGIAYLLFSLALFVLPPLFANALYYRHCKKKIAEVVSSQQDAQRQLGELSGKGGTSNIVVILILILAFVAFIGILAAIAIPAYQDYTTKAKMVGAAAVGQSAADSVGGYYNQYQELPGSLEQAGFAESLPPSVKEVTLDGENGTVTVTMANSPLDGKTLLFVPSLDESEQIVWTCASQDVEDRYLPPKCRQ